MKKVLLLALTIISFSCDLINNEDETNLILGKWIFHKAVYISADLDGGGANPSGWERMYQNIGNNYLSATIMDLSADTLTLYRNNPHEATWESYDVDYTLENDTLTFTTNYSYTFQQPFYISNDTLIWEIMGSYTESGEFSESQTDYYIRYNDNLPPDSWLTILENDQYEPDNSIDDANQISLNEPSELHVITLYDEDWFKFEYTSEYTYEIIVNGDFRLELDGEYSSSYNISQTFESESSGEYTFKVHHREYDGYVDDDSDIYRLIGYYTISVISSPKD